MKGKQAIAVKLNEAGQRLVRGDDPVTWAAEQLLRPYDKGGLIDLISVFGYADASAIMHQVMADADTQVRLVEDFRHNDIEYHVVSEPVRALLVFPLLCAGFGKQSSEIQASVTRTHELPDEALFELYLMADHEPACASLINRYTQYTLDAMELKLQGMKARMQHHPIRHQELSSTIWVEVDQRLNGFVPSDGSSAARELLRNIAGHPRPIPLLRTKILDDYCGTLANDKSTVLGVVEALCHNQNPQAVIEESPDRTFPRYLKLTSQFSTFSEDYQNETLLRLLEVYSNKFLLIDAQARPDLQNSDELRMIHRTVGQVALTLSRQKYSTSNFNFLLELTRALSPDLRPGATASSKVIDRLMALAPLMAIDYKVGKQGKNLRDALVAFGVYIAKKYQLAPDKMIAKVTTSLQAEWVGRIAKPDLSLHLADSDLMLNWKLENDLGL